MGAGDRVREDGRLLGGHPGGRHHPRERPEDLVGQTTGLLDTEYCGTTAEVLGTGSAGGALSAGQERVQHHLGLHRRSLAGGLHQHAGHLVPGPHGVGRAPRQVHAAEEVKVSAADTAGGHPDTPPSGRKQAARFAAEHDRARPHLDKPGFAG